MIAPDRKEPLSAERAYLEGIARMKSISLGETIFYEHDAVDAKNTGLLTHVSIMIAFIALFYRELHVPMLKLLATFELFLYLLITIGCLLAIRMVGPSDTDNDDNRLIRKRIAVNRARRRVYKMSLHATIVVTVAVVFTLGLDWLLPA